MGLLNKALFVTHDVGLYGASQSLQLLLRNLHCQDVDLLVNRHFLTPSDTDVARSLYGDHARGVYSRYLPFDPVYRGRKEILTLTKLKLIARGAAWTIGRHNLERWLARMKYDFIHVNSLALHEVVNDQRPFILHVREILDNRYERVAKSLMRAAGVIFIDKATAAPFESLPLRHQVILNNPIDMTQVGEADHEQLCEDLDSGRHVVFAIIGRITENKGLRFLIRAFRRVRRRDWKLLIVGSGDAEYIKQCRAESGGDDRITFMGERADVARIYRVSDYIVRGEAYPCVGRTVYEGLYAGCEVIVPGEPGSEKMFFEHHLFERKIHLYSPRDLEGLVKLLDTLATRKVSERVYLSNVDKYVNEFEEFVIKCIRH